MTVVASNYARAANDLYQTEPWATEAFLRHFPVAGMNVLEPAAGNHLMADVLRESGAKVFTSDIATYDRTHDAVFDFLNGFHSGPASFFDAIITNPPYGRGNRDAVKFTQLALDRCAGLVAMLLTAKFDFGKTRRHLFADNPRFWAKIALVDRISWAGNGETGTEDHAWYVLPPEVQEMIEQGKQQIAQQGHLIQQMQAYILALESDKSNQARKVEVDQFNAETKRLDSETKRIDVLSDIEGGAVPNPGAEYDARIVAEAQANSLNARADRERANAGLATAKAVREMTPPDPLTRIIHAHRPRFQIP